MPFMDQILYTLLYTLVVIASTSLSISANDDDLKGITLVSSMFVTDRSFNIAAYAIMIILAVLYVTFW
ncbi:hypothetical protein [Photorhabdus sp. SF281]|uniref:hypothetical protein n=1 Tax=Photorhabdus sp. SF281 TaxID=3459527 RepID=UPI004044EB7F